MIRALVVHPGTQTSFRLATELHRLGALADMQEAELPWTRGCLDTRM